MVKGWLPDGLGLDRRYITMIKEKAKKVSVTEDEERLVNRYTPIDARLNFWKKEDYKTRFQKMWESKVKDYKFFVALYEDKGGTLPDKVEAYIRASPCGREKLRALKSRDKISSDGSS